MINQKNIGLAFGAPFSSENVALNMAPSNTATVVTIITPQPTITLTITVFTHIKPNHRAKKISPEMLTGVIHLRPIKNLPRMSYPILEPERSYDMRAGSCWHIIRLS